MTVKVNDVEVYERYTEWAVLRDGEENNILTCDDEADARDMLSLSMGLGLEGLQLVKRTVYVMPYETVA